MSNTQWHTHKKIHLLTDCHTHFPDDSISWIRETQLFWLFFHAFYCSILSSCWHFYFTVLVLVILCSLTVICCFSTPTHSRECSLIPTGFWPIQTLCYHLEENIYYVKKVVSSYAVWLENSVGLLFFWGFFYKADSSQLRCLSACACCSPSFIYTAQKQQSPGHPLSPVVCEALKDTRENKESKHRETRHPDLDAGWEHCGSVCTQSCQRGNKNADVCQRSGTVVDQILTIVTIPHIEKYIFIHMKFKDWNEWPSVEILNGKYAWIKWLIFNFWTSKIIHLT